MDFDSTKIVLYSACSSECIRDCDDPFSRLCSSKSGRDRGVLICHEAVVWFVLGLGALYCASKFDYRNLKLLARPLLYGTYFLMFLLYTPLRCSRRRHQHAGLLFPAYHSSHRNLKDCHCDSCCASHFRLSKGPTKQACLCRTVLCSISSNCNAI